MTWISVNEREGKPLLVVSRNPNEHLYIGGEIRIKVTKVVGDTVFLGVTAPKHIPINRSRQGLPFRDGNPRSQSKKDAGS